MALDQPEISSRRATTLLWGNLMTAKNSKSQAVNVDVLPQGCRVITKDGDYALVEEERNVAVWYHLSPPPAEVPEISSLRTEQKITRQVGDLFQTVDGDKITWYKLVPPVDIAKLRTYFVVLKVQHETLILKPDVLLIRYRRDGTMEWVRNIQVAEKKFKSNRKVEKYAKGFGASPQTIERLKQREAGKAMALVSA